MRSRVTSSAGRTPRRPKASMPPLVWALLALVIAAAADAEEWRSSPIAEDLRGPLRLAVAPTGQTLFALQGPGGDVLGIDLEDPSRRWVAVPAAAGVRRLAVGAIDSGTLATVVRDGDSYSLRVHKLPAPGAAPSEGELQSVPLGVTGGTGGDVRLVVSPARDWLVVVGLPEPLPRFARATITGNRVGGISERRCPRTSVRPGAVAVAANAEWIVLGPGDEGGPRSTHLSWFSPSGAQRLLLLDTGLTRAFDAAACRDTGLLWLLASGEADTGPTSGLWRVDAALVDGRQRARGVPVAPLPAATAVVCLPKGEVAVAEGEMPARIARFTRQVGADRGQKEGDAR